MDSAASSCKTEASLSARDVNHQVDGMTPEERRIGRASNLQDVSGAAYLYASLATTFPDLDPATYQSYVDKQLEQCGGARDPIERLLLEQMLLAHHCVGRLCLCGTRARSVEEAKAYNDSAARFMAEFRRTALALKAYRTAAVSSVTVVNQQIIEKQGVA